MKFSIALPRAGPAGTPDNRRTAAVTAAELGFDHVKMGEHGAYPVTTYPVTTWPRCACCSRVLAGTTVRSSNSAFDL